MQMQFGSEAESESEARSRKQKKGRRERARARDWTWRDQRRRDGLKPKPTRGEALPERPHPDEGPSSPCLPPLLEETLPYLVRLMSSARHSAPLTLSQLVWWQFGGLFRRLVGFGTLGLWYFGTLSETFGTLGDFWDQWRVGGPSLEHVRPC